VKHTKLISGFLLLLVITFSLVALLNPKISISSEASTPFVSQSIIQEISLGNQNTSYLNQTTRVQIYNFITGNPGTNFRGICSALALPIGVVQYHLALLDKGNLVSNRRDGRNKRYFVSKKFSEIEMTIISVLRHETAKKILQTLREEGNVSHGKLAKRLEISSQALTWQMKQLKEKELVSCHVEGLTVNYSLAETLSTTVNECLFLVK
jgi:predicted transcriptional regulator